MAFFVPGSVAASTDSPAPSETPIRIGRAVLPARGVLGQHRVVAGLVLGPSVVDPDVKLSRYAFTSKPTTKKPFAASVSATCGPR